LSEVREVLDHLEAAHGFRLSRQDEATITNVYHEFLMAGPEIRFDPDAGSWVPT